MGVLSNELSSWRKNIVSCSKHEVTTLNFRDTRPNVMLVMNPTENEIFCNLDSIPTEKHYDFRIKNHYARLVGKPVATSQVYFLNTSDENVELQVYSIYDKNFDPSWLSDFSIDNINIGNESVSAIVDAISKNSQSAKIVEILETFTNSAYGLEGAEKRVGELFYSLDSIDFKTGFISNISNSFDRLLSTTSTSNAVGLKEIRAVLQAIQDTTDQIESAINILASPPNMETLNNSITNLDSHLLEAIGNLSNKIDNISSTGGQLITAIYNPAPTEETIVINTDGKNIYVESIENIGTGILTLSTYAGGDGHAGYYPIDAGKKSEKIYLPYVDNTTRVGIRGDGNSAAKIQYYLL